MVYAISKSDGAELNLVRFFIGFCNNKDYVVNIFYPQKSFLFFLVFFEAKFRTTELSRSFKDIFDILSARRL